MSIDVPVQRRKTIEKHLRTVKREGYKLAEPRGTISSLRLFGQRDANLFLLT